MERQGQDMLKETPLSAGLVEQRAAKKIARKVEETGNAIGKTKGGEFRE